MHNELIYGIVTIDASGSSIHVDAFGGSCEQEASEWPSLGNVDLCGIISNVPLGGAAVQRSKVQLSASNWD